MRFSHLKLKNWRNFREVDVPLRRRVFLVGPNAAGKSNFLDVFRFLRDIAEPQGGFLRAVQEKRRGVSQLRSLHARLYSDISIEVEVELNDSTWSYCIEFNQNNQRMPVLKRESLRRDNKTLFTRPDPDDRKDDRRLTQTYVEQVNANKDFRELAEFFAKIRYLHIVPQLIREPDRSVGKIRDPYGGDFLEQLVQTPKKIRDSRLRRIQDALRVAVPQLKELKLERDERGVPHLGGLYEHWRPNAGWQNETQFSDGTLRLMGLLWSLLDGSEPILLEEPELSLHAAVVHYLPQIMNRISRKNNRQILVSTHSATLLQDQGIAAEETLLLLPSKEGTQVRVSAEDVEIRTLVEHGMSIGEAVLPRAAPQDARQLSLFGE